MAIEFKKQAFSGNFPEIWRGECKMLPGGFKPVQEVPVGTVLRRAVPLFIDFDAMSAAICKTARILNGGTTTKPRVPKGHYFAVGDSITKHGDTSAKLVLITAIDTTNEAYDTLTLQSAYTGLAANDVIVEGESVTTGEGDSAETKIEVKYTPNMIVGAEKHFDGKGLPTIDAAFEAVVLTPSLNFPMLPEWLNGVCLKNNPNIIYIKQ